MPYIKTQSGINWSYDVEGEGEVLLFIHGWGVNMRIWRQQSKYFSQSFKTIIIDLPGHGRTSWQKVTLENIARDINEVIDQLSINHLIIVGSSLGGLVGLKVAQLHPEKMRGIVLVGSQPKFAQSENYPFGLEVSWIRKLSQQIKEKYPSMVNIFFRSLFTYEERRSRRFRWIQTFRRTDVVPHKVALLDMLDIIENEDLRGVLPALNCPIQFIYGDSDYICTEEFYEYMKEHLPSARFDSFAQCGHFPFLSKPHEFNNILEEFLKENA